MLKKMGLKIKLIVLFLLVGLVPVAIIGLLSYNNAQDQIRAEVLKQLELYAGQCKNNMEVYFENIRHDAKALATTRDIYQSLNILAEVDYDTRDPAWLERTKIIGDLMTAMAEDKGYEQLSITNPRGIVIYSTINGLMGSDMSDRNYIQDALQGHAEWSQFYFSTATNCNLMTVAAPVLSEGRSGKILGTFSIAVNEQEIDLFLHDGLWELGESADAFLFNEDGLLYSNSRLGELAQGASLKRNIATQAVELLGPQIRAGNLDYYTIAEFPDFQGNPVLASMGVLLMGRAPVGLQVKIDQTEAFAGVTALRNKLIPIIAVSAIAIALIAFAVAGTIVRPVQKMSNLTEKLAEGDFTVKAEIVNRDEIGQMAAHLNHTIQILSETLQKVQEASNNVSHASSEISTGNQDLSQRTEEQASSLEEIASTIEEISSSLETSSVNAGEAERLAKGTVGNVHRGEKAVKDMQQAMEEITRGSQEIAEIIATVNDIAFQTNLLALNAAVEAARAGEQGRGFAVVAAEVRNLAGRAAESAKEIEKRIKDSIDRVDKGNLLINETENVLQEIVVNAEKADDGIGEIAAALLELATAVKDIRDAIEELNQVTQQNASLVEEIASSSENMNSEAVELAEQVGFFKISENMYQTPQERLKKEAVKPLHEINNHSRKNNGDARPVAQPAFEKDFHFNQEEFEKF